MQSALRLVARRAAGAASRRGVSTATGGERERPSSQVQLEVRAQMLAAEEAALQRATEAVAEASARRRATEQKMEARSCWRKGYFTGVVVGAVGMLFLENILENK